MSNIVNSTRKNKHLTFDDRLTIEAMLKSQSTFSEIARTIGKDASTISKEVRKHRELAANNWTRRDDSGRVLNDECPKLTHSPYVCNGCKQKPYCHLWRPSALKTHHRHANQPDCLWCASRSMRHSTA